MQSSILYTYFSTEKKKNDDHIFTLPGKIRTKHQQQNHITQQHGQIRVFDFRKTKKLNARWALPVLRAPATASQFSSRCRLHIACWFPSFSHYSLSACLSYQTVSNGRKDAGHVLSFHPRPALYDHSSTSPQSLHLPCICLAPSSSGKNFQSLTTKSPGFDGAVGVQQWEK